MSNATPPTLTPLEKLQKVIADNRALQVASRAAILAARIEYQASVVADAQARLAAAEQQEAALKLAAAAAPAAAAPATS